MNFQILIKKLKLIFTSLLIYIFSIIGIASLGLFVFDGFKLSYLITFIILCISILLLNKYQNKLKEKSLIDSIIDGIHIEMSENPVKVPQEILEKYENHPNPVFHRTDKEDDLAFEFEYSEKHHKKISEYEAKMFEAEKLAYKFQKDGDKENTTLYFSKAIATYDEFRKYCYKTKGGKLYFQNNYEFLHNSKNPCFSYKDLWKEKL